MNKGDYVLATKYSDGDPGDQYAVGFFDGMLSKVGGDRYLVVNGDGKNFRGNGFRRCEPINDAEGRWLIARFPDFKPMWVEENDDGTDSRMCGKSVWDWLAEYRTGNSANPKPSPQLR